MDVTGRENLTAYRARLADGPESPTERNFCTKSAAGL
jgi:hypothetical protein